ncbi:MAG: threonylcarbamoyladenosine tRNA methylthiotransferase MtaB [Myxococcota bacterium]|jgi:threonylcarbamoyladenosine tRNA methylthiotransferase MtaB
MLRVSLATLGCKANQADTAALRDSIAAEVGLVEFVSPKVAADVVVVNTCTVTHTADADARQIIRRAHRQNPEATIVVTGCYAQTDRAALESMDEVTHVVGNVDKSAVASLVGRVTRGEDPTVAFKREGHRDWNPTLRDAAAIRTLPRGLSRPFVKVQDGCDYVCSFCIIPTARGVSRSLPMDEVVDTINAYADAGAQEVVLTGIHLGHWGRDLQPKRRFSQQLQELLERTARETTTRESGGPRLRISSLEPNEVDKDVLALVQSHPRICPHLHVPLQSGHDGTLARMRRVYRTRWYTQIIERFRDAVPRGAWGIDVMVGFPGESDADFQETYRYLRDLDFTYLHVFPYSPRRGTVAASMTDQVSPEVKRARSRLLVALSNERRQAHIDASVGESARVLVEDRRHEGQLRGYTEHYVPLLLDGPDTWRNQLVSVTIEASVAGFASGVVV